ncbi:MAG: aldehyde dehydrogenase family protein [Candidatus Wildermuthbacteria bacterium]|nr:aldehyde dehydrogenase family protein [Candidatus Wildermuthbacteria bacterium]
MTITTLLAGRAVHGGVRKKIVYPYSGSSSRFLQYARDLSINPYERINDLSEFRSKLLAAASAFRTRFSAEQNGILDTVAQETGSPIHYHIEDLRTSQNFLDKLSYLEKLLPKKYISDPKGNVLLILSANEPVIVTTILVFSSLFAGNTVFIKPSAKTPTYGYFFVKELVKFPFLKQRIHYLLTDKKEIGRLIKTKSFDFVLSFGSRTTSKKLAILCAQSEVEFLQESEGNDWVYIDKTCESLGEMSKIIVESFTRHNGQMCNSVRGVMVHSSLYDELVERLKNRISDLSMASPQLLDSRVGALILGTPARAKALTEDAAQRAENVWNFSRNENVITPTLILNPDDDALIISESVFAPILWVKKVKNHFEALSFYHKRNKHGLGFSIFSGDKNVSTYLANRIQAGRININKYPLRNGLWDPLGGVRLSGYGGPGYWVEKLSNRKYIKR